MNVGGDGPYASEINITPLVDVVLVLLIIFMVIVPVMMRGYDVDIPGEASAALAAEPRDERPEQVVLTIETRSCPVTQLLPDGPSVAGVRGSEARGGSARSDALAGLPPGCTVRLAEEEVAVADLAGRIGETFDGRDREDRVLFLAADAALNYEAVMRILDLARSGVEGLRVGVVTAE